MLEIVDEGQEFDDDEDDVDFEEIKALSNDIQFMREANTPIVETELVKEKCKREIQLTCIFYTIKEHRITVLSGGEGGIRTHVPVKANAFRVRPVMTASILLQIFKLVGEHTNRMYYTTKKWICKYLI